MRNIKILIICLLSGLGLSAQFGGGGGFSASSLWQMSSSKLTPKTSTAFTQTFQGYSIVNSTIDVGVTLPYVGLFGKSYGTMKAVNGFVDASGVGAGDICALGWIDLPNNKHHNIRLIDTTSFLVTSRSPIVISAVGDIQSSSAANISSIAAGTNTVTGTSVISSVSASIKTKVSASGFEVVNLGAEPSGVNGAIYYSTALNKFRVYENNAWRDM